MHMYLARGLYLLCSSRIGRSAEVQDPHAQKIFDVPWRGWGRCAAGFAVAVRPAAAFAPALPPTAASFLSLLLPFAAPVPALGRAGLTAAAATKLPATGVSNGWAEGSGACGTGIQGVAYPGLVAAELSVRHCRASWNWILNAQSARVCVLPTHTGTEAGIYGSFNVAKEFCCKLLTALQYSWLCIGSAWPTKRRYIFQIHNQQE